MKKSHVKRSFLRTVAALMGIALLCSAIPGSMLVSAEAISVSVADQQLLKKLEEELSVLKDNRTFAQQSYEEAVAEYDAAQLDYVKAYDAKRALDAEIAALEKEIDATNLLLTTYNEALTYYTDAIEEKKTEIDERYAMFLERIRISYEDSFSSYLEIILSSDSFSDLLYRVDVVASLLDYDKRVLSALDTAKKELVVMQTEYQSLQFKAQETLRSLTEQMPLLEQKRSENAELLAGLDVRLEEALRDVALSEELRQELENAYVTKKDELDQAEAEVEEKIRTAQEEAARKAKEEAERKAREEAERKAREEAERKAREEAEKKAREEEEKKKQEGEGQTTEESVETETQPIPDEAPTEEPQQPATPVVTGVFGWPTELSYKRITSYFGWRTDPITGKPAFHNGIDIPCAYGSSICAVDGGTVIISEDHYSYGNYIVIDHGNGLSTLYAHNTTNLVSVGDVVSKGQRIAAAGSSGYSTGNHCHFSVRVDGSPVDPMKYITVPN